MAKCIYLDSSITPCYYVRRNNYGFIENITCVNNTASEHYIVLLFLTENN